MWIESGEGEGAPEGGPFAETGGEVFEGVGREAVFVVVGGECGERGIEGREGDGGVEAGAQRQRVQRPQVVVQERADQVQNVCNTLGPASCRTGDGIIPSGISEDIACTDWDLGVEIKEARLDHLQLGCALCSGTCRDDVLVRGEIGEIEIGVVGRPDSAIPYLFMVLKCMLIEEDTEQSQRD